MPSVNTLGSRSSSRLSVWSTPGFLTLLLGLGACFGGPLSDREVVCDVDATGDVESAVDAGWLSAGASLGLRFKVFPVG